MTVLTPVHNGAAYLAECIESVVRQTYSDWSYVIVDNASTDATPEIAMRYAKNEQRIRLARFDEFVGLNENHNRAFRMVGDESAWCKIVQADDWMYDTCLELMVKAGLQSTTIGLVGAYQRLGDSVHLTGVPYDRTVFGGTEILRQSLTGGPNVTGGPTAVLLRSDLVRGTDPYYDPQVEHADTDAAYRILAGHDFGFVHQVLTYSRVRESRRSRMSEINAHAPEDVLFIVRYGARALSPSSYRETLRRELKRLVRYHITQAAPWSKSHGEQFLEYHRHIAQVIRREARGDRDVELAMRTVELLLRLHRIGHR